MSWRRQIAKIGALFRGRKPADDLAEEIRAHLEMEEWENREAGMSAEEARYAALRRFGNVTQAQETSRKVWGWQWWEDMIWDLRHGLRLLWKSPVFTATAALTIALAVGANTAVFCLVDAVVLQSLAVPAPQQLVFIEPVGGSPPSAAPPYPCLARLPNRTGSFSGLAIFATDEMRVEIDGRPEAIFGQAASGDYFEVLGVKPVLGRIMEERDENLDPPIAVIGYRYWQRRFNRIPGVLGQSITVGDRIYTIVGVTPPEFQGLEPGRPVDLTIPIQTSGQIQIYKGRWWFSALARLNAGVSLRRAQATANVVYQSCMADSSPRAGPGGERFQRLELRSAVHGIGTVRRRFAGPLFALMGIGVLVLLLATVNIATLLLARGIARSHEFAIRLATGASRVRLVRQLLTETLLLFGLGAAPGIVLAAGGVGIVTAMLAQGRRPITLEADLNWQVLVFTIVATLAASLLSSLFPVWRIFRTDAQQAIKEGQGQTSESHRPAALMRALVGFQVALSLVLLTGAIVFSRTLANLRHVDLGFENKDVLTMSVTVPPSVKADEFVSVWNRVLTAVRETPEVAHAALCVLTPLSGRDSGATPVRVRGYRGANAEESTVRIDEVSPGYFRTLGIPLLRGRLLSVGDRDNTLKVAVINESAARRLFGERDPMEQVLVFPRKNAVDVVYRIVGVVGDTKLNDLREPSPPFAFIPIQQPLDSYGRLTLAVGSAVPGGQAALLKSIRNRLAAVDPGLLVSEVSTVRRDLDNTLLSERLLSGLSDAFGVLALILASVGLYGVLSYRIGQQRRSIGIRMALGAPPSSVAFSVLRQSAWVIGVGLLCGMPFAFLAARTEDSLLWGVKPGDPTTYLIGAAILCIVGLVSSWLPARRAAKVDPMAALRYE